MKKKRRRDGRRKKLKWKVGLLFKVVGLASEGKLQRVSKVLKHWKNFPTFFSSYLLRLLFTAMAGVRVWGERGCCGAKHNLRPFFIQSCLWGKKWKKTFDWLKQKPHFRSLFGLFYLAGLCCWCCQVNMSRLVYVIPLLAAAAMVVVLGKPAVMQCSSFSGQQRDHSFWGRRHSAVGWIVSKKSRKVQKCLEKSRKV
jgi:hypothetical protein